MTKIQNISEIGREIRARRRELGYTQAFLAEYAGVSASFISELENGKGESVSTKSAQDETGQLSLLAAAQSPVIERLQGVDLNTLTPIEAMNLLYELKGMI